MTYLFLFLAGMLVGNSLNSTVQALCFPGGRGRIKIGDAAQARGLPVLVVCAAIGFLQLGCTLAFFAIGAWFCFQRIAEAHP